MNHADSSSGDLFRFLIWNFGESEGNEGTASTVLVLNTQHCVMKIFVDEKKDIEHIPEIHIK
jgi:hypothetical protein